MAKSSPQLKPASKAGMIRTAFRFLRDPQARTIDKLVLFLWFPYFLSPVDIIPDVIPLLGQADDAGVFLRAMFLLFWARARYRKNKA